MIVSSEQIFEELFTKLEVILVSEPEFINNKIEELLAKPNIEEDHLSMIFEMSNIYQLYT